MKTIQYNVAKTSPGWWSQLRNILQRNSEDSVSSSGKIQGKERQRLCLIYRITQEFLWCLFFQSSSPTLMKSKSRLLSFYQQLLYQWKRSKQKYKIIILVKINFYFLITNQLRKCGLSRRTIWIALPRLQYAAIERVWLEASQLKSPSLKFRSIKGDWNIWQQVSDMVACFHHVIEIIN